MVGRTKYDLSKCASESSEPQASERMDLLKGTLIILTYLCVSIFDASRVYHSIRGQSTIKLYVLFNVLDVLSPWGAMLS